MASELSFISLGNYNLIIKIEMGRSIDFICNSIGFYCALMSWCLSVRVWHLETIIFHGVLKFIVLLRRPCTFHLYHRDFLITQIYA